MKNSKILRWIILGAVLGGTMFINYLSANGGSISAHVVNPLGGLMNLWAWVAGQGNLQKIFSSAMILFFFTLIFALLFGRAFCGNICPFGALQEFVGRVSKKKFTVPEKTDKLLRYIKYLILVLATIMTWITATMWIRPYNPYEAFAHIWEGVEFNAAYIILVIVLLSSIFIERFFCKYLCPAGALYGIVSKISPTQIKRQDCSNCNRCSAICPMNINVSPGTINSAECIACGECVNICPSHKTGLMTTIFGKTIKPSAFVMLTVMFFFGSIFIFNTTGIYRVTVPTSKTIMDSGKHLKISELRGMMSIETGAASTGKQLKEFYEIMEIPDTVPKETLLKEVGNYVPGYDFHVIREKKQ